MNRAIRTAAQHLGIALAELARASHEHYPAKQSPTIDELDELTAIVFEAHISRTPHLSEAFCRQLSHLFAFTKPERTERPMQPTEPKETAFARLLELLPELLGIVDGLRAANKPPRLVLVLDIVPLDLERAPLVLVPPTPSARLKDCERYVEHGDTWTRPAMLVSWLVPESELPNVKASGKPEVPCDGSCGDPDCEAYQAAKEPGEPWNPPDC